MPCQFCWFDCWVPVPKEAPESIREIVRNMFVGGEFLSTCPGGQKYEKELLGINYDEIMAALVAEETERSIARLIDCNERTLAMLLSMRENAIVVMEHNGQQWEDYEAGPVDIVFSEEEAKEICKKNLNRFYYQRLENGKFIYA